MTGAGRVLGAWILAAFGAQEASERPVDFRRDVHPLLQARCFKCHSGPSPKSGVRLDRRPEILGESTGRPLVVPGAAAKSRLLQLVSGTLEREVMPPQGERLGAAEIAVLRAWIDQGLAWDEDLLPSRITSDHWAFKPVRRPAVPARTWGRNEIDAFVGGEHAKRGLTASPEAPRAVLHRRLSLDLLGLPPSPEEVRAFEADPDPDAYGKLVERLLASVRYGERWGRHWLDVARYADSEGYESNHPRPHQWRYRDYVVDSFNRDKPFDRFLREQLAGDEIEPYADEHLVATGFLAAARLSSNEEDKALQRNDVLVDVVNATGQAFLGLTIACAQCHNHKLEPITQRDYYRLQAYFVKGMPNNLVLRDPALRAEAEARRPAELEPLVRLNRLLFESGRRRFIENAKKRMSPETLAALEIPDGERTPEQRELARLADLAFQATPDGYERMIPQEDKALYQETKKKLDAIRKQGGTEEPQTWGYYAPSTSPHGVDVVPMTGFYPLPYEPVELARAQGYLLVRGEVHRRGARLSPGVPEVLGGKGGSTRLTLADWMTSRENPLVARVWANRVWHWHFGRGLVATPGDFGTRGEAPTHPELLDWLASELLEGGWSTKRLHRLIVNSATYRQSSRPRSAEAARDPENRFLWRFEPRRLEAEAIRDSVLAAGGELDLRVGGSYVQPDRAEQSLRRSLYLMQKRDAFPGFQAMFDAPGALESCASRHVSTVSLQPLLLLNSAFMVERSRGFAARVLREGGDCREAQVGRAYEIALGRRPDAAELEAGADFLARGDASSRLAQFCQVLLNLNEFVYVE
jgi:hypothetical protein